jgi:hypothetical protein
MSLDGKVTMARSTEIVPPKPRVAQLRVMRRHKMRWALRIGIGATVSTLGAVVLLPTNSHAGLINVLAGIACVSGMAAVLLRFVEKPHEAVLHKVRHEQDPPGLLR